MKRVVCIWFPNWPVQRLLSVRPELEFRPLVLYEAGPRGFQVLTFCQRASEQGLWPGMPLAEARSLFGPSSSNPRAPLFQLHNPSADRLRLRELVAHCQQYSPLVGWQPASAPEAILLDLTGCGSLVRNEQTFAEQVHAHFAQQRLKVQLAVADTVGTAWAMAHFPETENSSEPAITIVPSQGNDQILPALPVAALRLELSTLSVLHELGLETISQLQSLPRSSLPSRLGPEVLWRLDQALGQQPEPISAVPLDEISESIEVFEPPLENREWVPRALRPLLEQLARPLVHQNKGLQQFRWELMHPSDVSHESTVLLVDLLRPSHCVDHLLRMATAQFEKLGHCQPICWMRLEATSVSDLQAEQKEIFTDAATQQRNRQFQLLLEKLSNRLGPQAVLQAQVLPDAQPEFSYQYRPAVVGGDPQSGTSAARPELQFFASRPVLLKPRPTPITVLALAQGPPMRMQWNRREYPITRSWGPERIETGWWRDQMVRRDYYRIETEDGQRWWIFQHTQTKDWFLHGVYA